MYRRGKRKFISRFLIIMFVCLLAGTYVPAKRVDASSATLTFSTSTPEVKKGDTFSIVLTLTSSATIGDFEAYVSYDSDIMEFKTGGSFVSGGDGLLRVSDINTETADSTKKYSMKFKAIDVGACEVGISDTAIAYDYDEGSEMSLSSNRLSISVISSVKLSTNNNLETLKISPGTLTPEFSSKITSYTTDVPSDTEKLFVSGVPADTDAIVTVKGNESLKIGDNSVVITVEAPSGDKKEYQLLVKREESSIVPDTSASPEPVEDENQDGFSVFEKDGNTYINNSYQYQVMSLLDDSEIPAGYKKTSMIINGISVEAFSPENNPDSEYLLIYAMSQDGTIGFYQYDRVEQTMQRYDSDAPSYDTGNNKVMSSDEYNSKLQSLSIAIAILSALCVFLIIVVIRCYFKLKGFHEDEY